MIELRKEDVNCQFLRYDFTYEGIRHRGKVKLDEDTPTVYLIYDEHDKEITWVKVVRHRGKLIEVNITLCDDDDSPDYEHVVASAWNTLIGKRERRDMEKNEEMSW